MSCDLNPRYTLWIDGAGTWQVSSGRSYVIGGGGEDSAADIRLLASLSRRHAMLELSGESWYLKPASVSGLPSAAPVAVLGSGSLISLLPSVGLRFQLPSVLALSAVLTLEGSQRFVPHVDGVVLLADRMLLGPDSGSHIRCVSLPGQLVLFLLNNRLFCRSKLEFQVNGRTIGDATELVDGAVVLLGDFRMRVEKG